MFPPLTDQNSGGCAIHLSFDFDVTSSSFPASFSRDRESFPRSIPFRSSSGVMTPGSVLNPHRLSDGVALRSVFWREIAALLDLLFFLHNMESNRIKGLHFPYNWSRLPFVPSV